MSSTLLIILAAVLGLIAGGFVNVLVLRTRDSLRFGGRRTCLVCAEPHGWSDTIPVLSYLRLKGRCRRCNSALPWQYPLIEIVYAGLFALFACQALRAPETMMVSLFVRDALVSLFLIPIFMFDLRASVIPDRLTVPAMIVAIIGGLSLGIHPASILLGGFLLGGFFALQYLLSRGRWVGGGDIRLGMVMGFLLGPVYGVLALFIAYVLGAFVGIFLISTKRKDIHSHVPFGTFLVVATFVVMLWGQYILDWYLGYF